MWWRCLLEPESPQACDQFSQKETREDEASVLKRLVYGRDPSVVLDAAIAVDEGDEDVGQQTRDVKSNQGENQIVLLLRLEQSLAPFPSPSVCADLVWAALLVQLAVTGEERLLFAGLVHGEKVLGRS